MRLTKTFRNGEVHTLRTCCAKYYKKLSQLEDIEEELGIDLITLFKALTEPIYLYHNNKIIKEEQAPILLNFGEEDKKEYGFELYFEDDLDVEQVYLKDYGKTWALTKEELL